MPNDAKCAKDANGAALDKDAASSLVYEDDNTRISLYEMDHGETFLQKAREIAGKRASVVDISRSDDLLERPYDFDAVYQRFESSALLRPNIDAYVTNIDSFGHYFIPAIDLASGDLADRVEAALIYERALQVANGEVRAIDVKDPSENEVNERIATLHKDARLEYMKLKAFFSYACSKTGFITLRRKLRQDLEVIGNGWWEVLRNAYGDICRIHYVNPLNMWIADPSTHAGFMESADVTRSVKHTDITWVAETEPQYFNLFAKKHPSKRIYYKEFGDPRLVSQSTGAIYKTPAQMRKEEGSAKPATELLHFRLHSPRSEYGIPRWAGSLPSVLGSIELDNVNYEYFDNNVIPPLALLVSGGRLGAEAAQRIERTIEDRIKGRKGINRLLIIEARGHKSPGDPGPVPAPKLQFVPLRAVQQTDALFQSYDQRNEEKVAAPFRLPRMLRGVDTQLNRATAQISMRLAEEQIFEPEREAFDQVINSEVIADLGIRFWAFRSNAPIVRDPEKMSEMIEKLVKVGVLLPGEARELLQDIFNRQFLEIKEKWTGTPMPMILAQLKGQPQGADDEDDDDNANTTPPVPEEDDIDRPPPNKKEIEKDVAHIALKPLNPMQALGDDHDEE